MNQLCSKTDLTPLICAIVVTNLIFEYAKARRLHFKIGEAINNPVLGTFLCVGGVFESKQV